MMKLNYSHRSLGIYFNNNGEAEINVWAPLHNKAELFLVDKHKKLSLEKNELGFWTGVSDALQPQDLYKIILNDEKHLPDPASLSQPEGVHGSSQAIDTNDFAWTDADWQNLSLADYIIYELHTGTFTEEGTFSGIEKKLDHLIELGITAIELMPLAQFPGERNWGYDGVFPFAIQNSYGGIHEFQKLVNSCHEKGLAVIVDVVYNHLGPEGNYLSAFAPYFTGKYKTPWGSAINFDDEYSYGVRHYFIENVLMWFRDLHIDALRLDAVHAIKDFSATQILQEIRMHVDELMNETGRKHYLIVESDLNDPKFINPVSEGGFGMDAQWIDEFHHALRVTAGGDKMGYYSDFNGIEHLAKSYKDAYVYDGQYSLHRKKYFGIKANKNEGHQFIVFSQNHDQVGNRMLGERSSELFSFELQKLLASSVILSPYLPMLFMGEEWSEQNRFQYFVSHTDAELAEAVRKGRKEEFAAFHEAGEAPDPMAVETFSNSKLQWHLIGLEPHATMLRFYKKLIQIRKVEPALKNLSRKNISVEFSMENNTLMLHRWQENNHIICYLNFSAKPVTTNFFSDKTGWQLLLNSASPVWK
ncbi:MAG: malto-oligosyltrehalose trehalohydrolase, partial [Bacteroidota bacterium]|nr:malto-oligosyltrehalose trehalohydrolase [Bacteroidota bacterium]